MYNWLQENWLELFGVLSGFLYIFLEIKGKIWLWPVGLITSALYIVVFYNAKFYADMGLQWYYLGISIYGWIYWIKGDKSTTNAPLPIKQSSSKSLILLGLITVILFVGMGYILSHFTDSPIPWWDAFTTSLSITATWMLARKLIEQWWIWMVVNLVSVCLYIYKDLDLTAGLFIAYFALAIAGYIQWRKMYKAQIN